MKLIATATVASTGVTAITFNSIPQTFTDLAVMFSVRENTATGESFMPMSINSATTGFNTRGLVGTGSAVQNFNQTTGDLARTVGYTQGNSYTANTFANIALYIPNYRSGQNKAYSVDSVTENNATAAFSGIFAGQWANTAAITSLSFSVYFGGSSWVVGSTASLYGITAGTDGIVTTSP